MNVSPAVSPRINSPSSDNYDELETERTETGKTEEETEEETATTGVSLNDLLPSVDGAEPYKALSGIEQEEQEKQSAEKEYSTRASARPSFRMLEFGTTVQSGRFPSMGGEEFDEEDVSQIETEEQEKFSAEKEYSTGDFVPPTNFNLLSMVFVNPLTLLSALSGLRLPSSTSYEPFPTWIPFPQQRDVSVLRTSSSSSSSSSLSTSTRTSSTTTSTQQETLMDRHWRLYPGYADLSELQPKFQSTVEADLQDAYNSLVAINCSLQFPATKQESLLGRVFYHMMRLGVEKPDEAFVKDTTLNDVGSSEEQRTNSLACAGLELAAEMLETAITSSQPHISSIERIEKQAKILGETVSKNIRNSIAMITNPENVQNRQILLQGLQSLRKFLQSEWYT
jgi:hypothetical protein